MSTITTSTPNPTTGHETSGLDLLRALSRLRWLGVGSSAISQVAYNHSARTLYTQMRGNDERVYAYRGVGADVFLGLATAPSAGSYFVRFIRDEYPTDRIEFAVEEVA